MKKDAAWWKAYRAEKKLATGSATGAKSATETVQPEAKVATVAQLKKSLKERDTEIEALRAEVARLKQALAGRPVTHTPMPPTFAGSFSRAAQAKGQIPNRSPMGRMYASQEDNW
jgi:hypothetical protein